MLLALASDLESRNQGVDFHAGSTVAFQEEALFS